MLHSPTDLSQYWQLRSEKTQRPAFELGVNLFIYAAGKADLRNRLSSLELPAMKQEGAFHLRMGRLKYGGLWDPEPGAFGRFAKWFGYQTGYQLDLTTITVGELDAAKIPIVHVTGTAAWTPSDNEAAILRRYVNEGGVLLIDACGGAWPFGQSMSGMMGKHFADAKMSVVELSHPLMEGKADGMGNLGRPVLRAFTEQKLGEGGGED